MKRNILALLLIPGCAALDQQIADYQAGLDALAGSSEAALVVRFGLPERVEELSSTTQVLHWEATERGEIVNQEFGQAPPPAGERLTLLWRCRLSIRLVDDMVESSQWAATRGYVEHPDRGEVESLGAYPCSQLFSVEDR